MLFFETWGLLICLILCGLVDFFDFWVLFAGRSAWSKLAEVRGIFSNKSYSGSGSSSLVFLFAAGFFFWASASLSVSDRTYSSYYKLNKYYKFKKNLLG